MSGQDKPRKAAGAEANGIGKEKLLGSMDYGLPAVFLLVMGKITW